MLRGAIHDVEVVPLADTEPRCAILAAVTVADRRLSVCATHLGLRGQAKAQLPILLEALRARPGPRVLLGDLNLRPDDVVAPGFTRVEAGPTYPADAPRREIDHVLLDGLVPTSAAVVHLPVSDHRAVVVELRSR